MVQCLRVVRDKNAQDAQNFAYLESGVFNLHKKLLII